MLSATTCTLTPLVARRRKVLRGVAAVALTLAVDVALKALETVVGFTLEVAVLEFDLLVALEVAAFVVAESGFVVV